MEVSLTTSSILPILLALRQSSTSCIAKRIAWQIISRKAALNLCIDGSLAQDIYPKGIACWETFVQNVGIFIIDYDSVNRVLFYSFLVFKLNGKNTNIIFIPTQYQLIIFVSNISTGMMFPRKLKQVGFKKE